MSVLQSAIPRRRIVLLNPKGGSGKTTLATNLAACYAARGLATALMDYDPQGSSLRWLKLRPANSPGIYGVDAASRPMNVTRSWQLRVPPETSMVIVDTAAAIPSAQLAEYTRTADAIVVPVGSSDMDIHAASRFIADLLLVARVNRREHNVAVVANRVNARSVASRKLMRFLDRLSIPVAATLRATQNYAHASDAGLGIHEFDEPRFRRDVNQWEPLLDWLERTCRRTASPGEMGLAFRSRPSEAVGG
ncbi:MAG: ParA family protein [Gammaproteobacteria bacterium]